MLALLVAISGVHWNQFSHHWYTTERAPRTGGEPDEIRRAVFADRRIWALAGGEIWTVDPTTSDALRTGVGASDVCVRQGRVVAVTARTARPDRLLIMERQPDGWKLIAETEAEGAGLVALDCSSTIRLLLSDRMITVGRNASHQVKLSYPIPAWPRAVVLAAGKHLLVGINAGEWGGAIWRVEPMSGAVEQLGRTDDGELCGPALERACIPINDLSPHPSRGDCSLAAVGNIADPSHGGLLEVCGSRVRNVPWHANRAAEDQAFGPTVFALGATRAETIAITVLGLHRLAADGAMAAPSRPSFKTAGPFQLLVQKDFAVLRAPVDERFHPGGYNGVVVQGLR